MAKRLVRQFKTQTPAEFKGSPAKRPISKLGGDENAFLQHPTQAGTAYTGKLSDDQGLKEHAAGAGGPLKIDPTVGGGGENYTLGQLLYQQQQAEANQPPPLPQPSANIPQAVDPRDLGYIPQQPPAMAMPPQIQLPTPMPPQVVMPPQPVDLSRIPNLPPLVPGYGQPPVPVDITPEQYTLPPPTVYPGADMPLPAYDRGIIPEIPPVTTPIERPTPIDIGYIEPEQPYPFTPGPQVEGIDYGRLDQPQPVETAYADPIQVEPQPQLEEPSPAAHYGELPVPQDEITELIDNIIPIETLAPQNIDISPTETTQPQIITDPLYQTDPSIYSPEVTTQIPDTAYIPEVSVEQVQPQVQPQPVSIPDPAQQFSAVQQLPITQAPELPMPRPVRQWKEGPEFLAESIVDDKEEFKGRIPTDTVEQTTDDTIAGMDNLPPAGGPHDMIFKNQEGDMVTSVENPESGPFGFVRPGPTVDQTVTETPPPVRQRKEGPEFLKKPVVDDREEFKGGPAVTTDITYDVDPRDFQDSRDLEQPEGPPLVDRGGQVAAEDTVVDTTGQETPQTPPPVTQPPVGQGRGWLYTGPQGYAQTRWSTSGASQGPPVVSTSPYVSGPQVNRETGEITEAPLSWMANRAGYDFMQNAPLPTGEGFPSATPTTPTTPEGTGTTMGGGALGTGFTADQVAEMAGGSVTPVLDYLHPGATSDGQTVTFGDVGDYDAWVDGTLKLDPTLKGIDDLGYQKRDAEGNRVGWGNHALDGFNQLTGAINSVFNFMGDPSKEFTADVLKDFGMKPTEGSNLQEMASNFNKFRNEAGQMWETSQDKAWGRKWNDLTKTQEYGDMQPLGIFALLTNPPAAIGMTANSLLYDIKNAVTGMFKDNPNYEGNKIQDILNGAFHLLGKAAKGVGSLFGKLGKKVGEKFNFTSKDMKNDPMEVSRQLLYASKNEDPRVGDIRYNLVKTILEGGVDVRFHNNAITFDKGIAKARIADIKKGISDMGLDLDMIEIMAGTQGLDEFPELKAWLEARADQIRDAAQS